MAGDWLERLTAYVVRLRLAVDRATESEEGEGVQTLTGSERNLAPKCKEGS